MLVNVGQLFGDSQCGGYAYTYLTEREIGGRVATLTDTEATDFGTDTARPGYDFRLNGMPVELKMTNGVALPIEMAKDREQTIPSGLAVTIAPVVIFVSNGHAFREGIGTVPVAKIRAFRTIDCLRAIKGTTPTFFERPNANESALVYYMTGRTVTGRASPYFTNDIWLGDMDYVQNTDGQTWSIDTSTFVGSPNAKAKMHWLIQGYHDGDI